MAAVFLNDSQAKGLANLFFDLAKGFILGGVGFATVGPLEAKVVTATSAILLAFLCVKFALSLLEEAA